MTPFFSVVVTVYNKTEFILDTLNSVLLQSFQDFEIVVINDGSTDNSKTVIESIEDKRIRLISTSNQGASLARNRGINEANCNFIALLDGDDEWDKDYLKHIHHAISAYPEYSIFTTAVAHKYSKKIVPARYNFSQNKVTSIHNFFESSLDHTILTSSSIVFKKQIIEITGYFDPDIKSGQDTDLWIRIGLHYDIVFIDKILAYYRFVSKSLSNTTFNVGAKPKFDKYLNEEQENKSLKIYVDRNRFPLAILSKLNNDQQSFDYYKNSLDENHLALKQKLLLKSPKWLIKLLLNIKSLKGEKLYYPKS